MSPHILFIGYGNPGRQDDGLGPAFIQSLECVNGVAEKVTLTSNYQLTVEDALDIADYEKVVFIDASLNATEPFSFNKLETSSEQSLGSHQLLPESVLQLCQTLYHAKPDAYVLAIRGYEFDDFKEALSAQAQANLNAALNFAMQWIDTHA